MFLPLFYAVIVGFSNTLDEIRPPAGIAIDKIVIVHTRLTIPSHCISTATNEVSIILDRSELEAFAKIDITKRQTEEDRLFFIRALRARVLLGATTDSIDIFGCTTLITQQIREGSYLIGEQLEKGQVVIIKSTTDKPESQITVRYYGMKCGKLCGQGEIIFSLPNDGEIFYRIDWWRS